MKKLKDELDHSPKKLALLFHVSMILKNFHKKKGLKTYENYYNKKAAFYLNLIQKKTKEMENGKSNGL